MEALKHSKDKDGNVVFETGDHFIDRWEKQLSQGIMPDLTEGMSEEEIEKLKKEQKKAMPTVNTLSEAEALVNKEAQMKTAENLIKRGDSKAVYRLDGKEA